MHAGDSLPGRCAARFLHDRTHSFRTRSRGHYRTGPRGVTGTLGVAGEARGFPHTLVHSGG